MKNFNFDTVTRVLFGKDKIEEMVPEILAVGSRVLLAYGGGSIKKSGLHAKVVSLLKENKLFFVELSGIKPNPRVSSVREGIRLCREHKLDFILAVGGGSVLDCSKAIAAGVPYKGDPWDFMLMKAQVEDPLPIGCVLTLAAAGSEMNGNAVISNEETLEKRAMSSPLLRPVFSVLDPVYTFTVDKYNTAAGITDAMSHIFEIYLTPEKGTHVQDMLAEGLLKTCIKYGPILLKEPGNYEARANVMWASTLALNGLLGMGKSRGDWATHMIEHEISAIYDLTHGAGLAIIHPTWMEYVLDSDNAWKFAQMARNVWNIIDPDDLSAAKKGINATRLFFSSLGMPIKLSEANINNEHFDAMAAKACLFGDLGYTKVISKADVKKIYENAL